MGEQTQASPDVPSSKRFRQRLVSGVVLAPVVLFLVCLGGWFFTGMVFLAGLIALYEFSELTAKGRARYAHLVFGTLYLSVCTGAFIFIHVGFAQGVWLVLCLILCVWASDTGAYVTGKTLKGPKMAPRLSPNKTWAGLGGAMFFCGLALAILFLCGKFFAPWLNTDLHHGVGSVVPVFVAGMVFGAVGQAGDLLMSFYKRRVGVKDSGALIPGHGGILDRIDALLLVAPVYLGALLLWL